MVSLFRQRPIFGLFGEIIELKMFPDWTKDDKTLFKFVSTCIVQQFCPGLVVSFLSTTYPIFDILSVFHQM